MGTLPAIVTGTGKPMARSSPFKQSSESTSTAVAELYPGGSLKEPGTSGLGPDGDSDKAFHSRETSPAGAVIERNRRDFRPGRLPQRSRQPRQNIQSERILRAHFAKHIVDSLKKIADYCRTPAAAAYANDVLRTIRLFRDQSPFDTYLEVVMSLHDAMAFENRWVEYDQSQYKQACKVLKACATQTLDNKKVQKAILKLREIGFDVTPFGVDVDFFRDEETAEDE